MDNDEFKDGDIVEYVPKIPEYAHKTKWPIRCHGLCPCILGIIQNHQSFGTTC